MMELQALSDPSVGRCRLFHDGQAAAENRNRRSGEGQEGVESVQALTETFDQRYGEEHGEQHPQIS